MRGTGLAAAVDAVTRTAAPRHALTTSSPRILSIRGKFTRLLFAEVRVPAPLDTGLPADVGSVDVTARVVVGERRMRDCAAHRMLAPWLARSRLAPR
jgi:hypothetical protein